MLYKKTMNIDQLLRLRKKVNWTQAQVAAELKVSIRTISNWETSGAEKQLSECDGKNICRLFQPLILEETIREMVKQAFEAIPSELVALWLVEEMECILLSNTTYLYFSPEVDMAQVSAPLVIESLTTYPLRTGETLNLAGNAILHHKAKKYKHNRAYFLFKGGVCESLLHIPAFIPSPTGPQPIPLLSLENKLKENEVIATPPGVTKIYTEQDEETAKFLAQDFRDRLLDDMKLLDMIR